MKTIIQKKPARFVYIIGILLALTACTSSEVMDTPPYGQEQEITFIISPPPTFATAAASRVSIDDIDEGTDKGKGKLVWEEGDVLYVTMEDAEGGVIRTGTLTYTSTKWEPNTTLRWPAGYDELNFRARYGSTTDTDERCTPAYIGSALEVSKSKEVILTFTSAVNQFVFRGIKSGQTLTLGAGWQEAKVNAARTGFAQPTITDCSFTSTGKDIVLYMIGGSSATKEELQYLIDGTSAGTLYGVPDVSNTSNNRYIIYCNNGGSTSAGEIAERERFLKWNGRSDFTLQCDIDLTGVTYTEKNLVSSCTFDGGGHTIRGLVAATGLFSINYNYGTIQYVIVQGAEITGTNIYTGAIANYNEGNIIGCQAIDCTIQNQGYYVGGIAGYSNTGTIIGCYTSGGKISGDYAGGIVGVSDAGTVTACYAAPTTVTGNLNTGTGAGAVVGGLYNDATTTACYWQCESPKNGVGDGTDTTTESTLANCFEAMNMELHPYSVHWSATGLVYTP